MEPLNRNANTYKNTQHTLLFYNLFTIGRKKFNVIVIAALFLQCKYVIKQREKKSNSS